MKVRWILPAAVALLVAGPVAGQTIDGRVLEQRGRDPIDAATVKLLTEDGTNAATALTDTLGMFELTAPAGGVYRLRLEREGYRTAVTPAIDLKDHADIQLTVRMTTDTIALAPITVKMHPRPGFGMDGFYTRMAQGMGYFFTPDQIQRDRPIQVSDLLMRVPGLWLTPTRFGFGYSVRTSTGCRPAVYLDGLRYPLIGETIDDIVQPYALEGMEVYTSAVDVPPQFSEFSDCGAILLWTR